MKLSTQVTSNSSAQSVEIDSIYWVTWKHTSVPTQVVRSHSSEQSVSIGFLYLVP